MAWTFTPYRCKISRIKVERFVVRPAAQGRAKGAINHLPPKGVKRLARGLQRISKNMETIVKLIQEYNEKTEQIKMDKRSRRVYIGAQLREFRKQSGLTIAEISRKFGISGSFLRDLEKGITSVPTSLFEKFKKLKWPAQKKN